MNRKTSVALLVLFTAWAVFAQDEPTEPTPEPPQDAAPAPGGAGGGGGRGGGANAQGPQPYERVITKEAKTSKGVFTVHVVRDRYYYEIPKSELAARGNSPFRERRQGSNSRRSQTRYNASLVPT
jgi:hypothetical protein